MGAASNGGMGAATSGRVAGTGTNPDPRSPGNSNRAAGAAAILSTTMA
ncbi:hypothetical protein CDQ89_18795 [Mycobacterium avium subsp. paratuberculosis]|nr:hypothetical protein CDQ89_18795 [Mycobacterium avium subsp. paratuberculosis]